MCFIYIITWLNKYVLTLHSSSNLSTDNLDQIKIEFRLYKKKIDDHYFEPILQNDNEKVQEDDTEENANYFISIINPNKNPMGHHTIQSLKD